MPNCILPGPVEIDETRVGSLNWSYLGVFPEKRWAFGLFCRTTKIPITYWVRNRNHNLIAAIVRKHTNPGTIVFSDEFSGYVNIQSG